MIFVLITMEGVVLQFIKPHQKKIHSWLSSKSDNYKTKIKLVVYVVSFPFFSCSISVFVRCIQYLRNAEIYKLRELLGNHFKKHIKDLNIAVRLKSRWAVR